VFCHPDSPGDRPVDLKSGTSDNAFWTDGELIESIRFIDRFHLIGPEIKSRQIWNDLVETRV